MLNSPKNKSLAFPKLSRSQSSLRSSNASESKRRSSYLESPLDSPLNSPNSSHHPLEKSTSNDFFGTPEPPRSDDSPTSQGPESSFKSHSSAQRGLQRSQSHRSPPVRFSASASPAGYAPSISEGLGENGHGNDSWVALSDKDAKPEPKKKRGFFRGLGDLRLTKESSSSSSQRSPRRLVKNQRAPHQRTAVDQIRQSQQSPYPSSPLSNREDESDEEIITKTFHRHSVALPAASSGYHRPPTPDDNHYSSASTTANREYFGSAPHAPPNTASGQSQPAEQGGAAHKGGWERIGRVIPHHHRNHSSTEVPQLQQPHPPPPQSLHPAPSSGAAGLTPLHRGRLDPNFSESSNSRPPSRQSLEPPSPSVPPSSGSHLRRRSSQNSSLHEGSMVAPGGPQHGGRGNMENSQPNTQAGARAERMDRA